MDKDRQMLLQPWEIFIVLHHNILSTRVLHICLYFPCHAYASLLHRLEVNSLLFEIERISNVATTEFVIDSSSISNDLIFSVYAFCNAGT